MNKEILIKRLALIKYLYKRGVVQSNESETLAGFSILSFHDSIEMFLILLAEHHNVRTEKLSLMEYWVKFPNLTLMESVRALKDRRVNIKHKGLFPSKSDIESSRICATDFFEQNTQTQFGIDFKEVSLFDLISYEEVKNLLIEAQEKLESGENAISLEKSATAFYKLMYIYEDDKRIPYSDPMFSFGEKISAESRLRNAAKMSFDSQPPIPKEVIDVLKDVEKSMDKIKDAIRMNCLGIDYKQYAVFKILTPSLLMHTTSDEFILDSKHSSNWANIKMTKENCQFCIDFVMETSLKLQEFDFNIEQYLEYNIE
ncbi:hypothetical protein FACS1894178_0100 [Bacteroidia bacterium]|nr:hypothetical protein FACS1894178_0100 [Bacteroidia bacterium]